ncbi:hypothetical protein BsWGS_17227 [Bradybaena similaris]
MIGLVLVVVCLMTSCVAGQDTQNCQASPFCFTKECVIAAAKVSETIDDSVNPCNDFYNFACGGWIQRQFLTPERQKIEIRDTGLPLAETRKMLTERSTSTHPTAEWKAKRLYASCVNHIPGTVAEDTAIVNAVRRMFGTWPLVCQECPISGTDLALYFIRAIEIGVYPLFSLTADPARLEFNSRTKRVKRRLNIDDPVLGFSDYTFLRFEPHYRLVYANAIYEAAKRFGIDDHDKAREETNEIVAVELTLAYISKLSKKPENSVQSTLDYINQRFGQLMNWTQFVMDLASLPSVGITDIAFNETVFVSNFEFMYQAVNYFVKLPTRTQVNYIIWRVVDSMLSVLIDIEKKLEITLRHAIVDSSEEQFRDEPCVKFVSKAFPLVVHRLLFGTKILEKVQKVNQMEHHLQEAFSFLLYKQNWIDEHFARIIQEKIDTITTVPEYLTEVLNSTFVDNYYSNVTIEETNFINNILSVRRDAFSKNMSSIRRFVKGVYPSLPLRDTTYFSHQLNEIYFNSILLQAPWFIDNAPMSLNYAGIGFSLANAFVHIIDLIGIQYLSNGTKGKTIDHVAIDAYMENLKCLIEQYDKYVYQTTGMNIDVAPTIITNFADNAGFLLAYKTFFSYMESYGQTELYLPSVAERYSHRDMFFIRAAQMQCIKESKWEAIKSRYYAPAPPEFRINGALGNLPYFFENFKCWPKSPMIPDKLCELW